MPVFAYRGLSPRGKAVSGLRDADSAKTLRALLRRDGVFVTEVAERRGAQTAAKGESQPRQINLRASLRRLVDRVRPQEVAVVTKQLATLLRAGITLAESLSALVDQTEHEAFKQVLADVRAKVNEGSTLADALAAHPRAFPDLYVSMVRAGETAGNLDSVLERLAEFSASQIRLRAKIFGALMYPIIMVLVGTAILGILMVVVIPKITVIFEDLGRSLPWNTQLLIFVSSLTGDYWWALLALSVVAVIGFRRWQRSARGRPVWDRLVLRAPLFGPLVRMIAISRFAKTLGTMLASGVPLLRSLDIVRHVLANQVLCAVIDEAHKSIKEGESIAAPLKRSGHFPPVVTHMIAIGEKSGQLEQMLQTVGDSYEGEVDMRIGRLTTLLEPLMILVMGVGVAFVVFSILIPILQINQSVTQ